MADNQVERFASQTIRRETREHFLPVAFLAVTPATAPGAQFIVGAMHLEFLLFILVWTSYQFHSDQKFLRF